VPTSSDSETNTGLFPQAAIARARQLGDVGESGTPKATQKSGSASLNLGVEAPKSSHGGSVPRVVLPVPFPLEVTQKYLMTAAAPGLFRLPGADPEMSEVVKTKVNRLSKLVRAKLYSDGMATEYSKFCSASQVEHM
jgi:hypothetical protein